MQSPVAQIQEDEKFSSPAMTKQEIATDDQHCTPQNSNSESSPPPQPSDDDSLACGGSYAEETPARKGPVQPAEEVDDKLDSSEGTHLALAVVTPTPSVAGAAQRGLWGMYSSTVLQRCGSGKTQGRRCTSPTRGARELAKILRSESGSVSSLTPSGSGSTNSPGGAAEQDPDGSSSEVHSAPSMLPLEDGVPETVSVVSEAPEIARARERAARARENAARAVEKARAQRAAEAAAKAAAKAAAAVRRRIPGKQKSPPAFPPPPTVAADAIAAQVGVAAQETAQPARRQEQEQEREQDLWSTPLTSPKKRKAQQDAAKGDMPTPPRSKWPRREEQLVKSHGVGAAQAAGSPSGLGAAASQGRGRGAAKR
mmetsp:Transcript_60231/g.152421  ORF Transcript_60231/g.152421 Transcript_60231/m.152421 type:complete len:369 (+) Transcript_60231:93-1199(+)